MAEDLGNAIVAAAEKMQANESSSYGIEALVVNSKGFKIVPLYEHTEKSYQRNNENEAFESLGFKTWCTLGSSPKKYESVFEAFGTITNSFNFSNNTYTLDLNEDEILEKLFIGRIVEQTTIKKSELCKCTVGKKIVALFKMRQPQLNMTDLGL